jgi:non-heme chloroperoxidase
MRSERINTTDASPFAHRMSTTAVLLASLVVACGKGGAATAKANADSTAAPATAYHDPSPHKVSFITAPGPIRIEVLDWGGQGEPLVFIAGLENTGHVFDDFAPQFTDHFHVLALTRRGWGLSDHPDSAYTIPDLVSDVHAALDSLHITHANLVGHSIAGQELSWMAVQHPDQVRRLVYLDAGFDYHTHQLPRPLPALAPMSAADSAPPAAGLAYTRRISGAATTESDYRATETLSPTGRDLGSASPPSFSAQVGASATAIAPPLTKIHVPVLAIYDWPTTAAESLPWANADDTASVRWLGVMRTWRKAQRDEFHAKVPQARIIVLNGASHYVFVNQPDTVAKAMRTFLNAPGK